MTEESMSATTTAAEVLVTHQRRDAGSCLCGWAELGRSHAAHQADALREAGLLAETTTEWGVKWPWAQAIEPNIGEESARWRAVNMHVRDGIVVRREVTEWREVQV